MKVTRELVKLFKRDQNEFGTKVAVSNLLWLQASEQLRDLGEKRVKTERKKRSRDGR